MGRSLAILSGLVYRLVKNHNGKPPAFSLVYFTIKVKDLASFPTPVGLPLPVQPLKWADGR